MHNDMHTHTYEQYLVYAVFTVDGLGLHPVKGCK